ncbi:hypothetical protein SBP02_08495 [Pseudomonas benzenivorans]|uniref:Lipoprotein n=1 Tax=Pseudomonas benzenivorans TaxID=556533 RepID=A0ABZ0Q108_9PSED|nr:hypothetical protein [Pseudomonas benzenivorans]WPC06769.1 hypothetical protein SBP02_08495 [Pseudomonas benzenivorans]
MFKRVLVCGFFTVLAGCDKPDDSSPTGQGLTEAESKNSSTAVYFPGGGIDFNKKPLFDNSRKDETGAHIGSITFSFEDSVEKILKGTDPVMIAQGYSVSRSKSDKCDPCMIYSKGGTDIAFAYNAVDREGSAKSTRLLIWWKEKK